LFVFILNPMVLMQFKFGFSNEIPGTLCTMLYTML
jgi:hypothetical protein